MKILIMKKKKILNLIIVLVLNVWGAQQKKLVTVEQTFILKMINVYELVNNIHCYLFYLYFQHLSA